MPPTSAAAAKTNPMHATIAENDDTNTTTTTTDAVLRFAEYNARYRNSVPTSSNGRPAGRSNGGPPGSPNMESKRKSEQLMRPSPSLKLMATAAQNIYANTVPMSMQMSLASDGRDIGDGDGSDNIDIDSVGGGGSDIDESAAASNRPRRKFHTKSLSMTENQILASFAAGSAGGGGGDSTAGGGTNHKQFHQNRELWEKRAERQSQQCLLTTQRILSRNRIAPDLVMDLPFPTQQQQQLEMDAALQTSSTVAASDGGEVAGGKNAAHVLRDDSLDGIDQLTSAERFASGSHCTLKKNERFSGDGCDAALLALGQQQQQQQHQMSIDGTTLNDHSTTSGAELSVRLHIDEPDDVDRPMSALAAAAEPMYADVVRKSPIPPANTKKFVNKFADLHLTGGCLTATAAAATTGEESPVATSNGATAAASAAATSAPASTAALSSFRPQVKAKPALLKKPLVVPATPEMSRRTED